MTAYSKTLRDMRLKQPAAAAMSASAYRSILRRAGWGERAIRNAVRKMELEYLRTKR